MTYTTHDFLKPGFTVNDDNRADFKAWIEKNRFKGKRHPDSAPPVGMKGENGKRFVAPTLEQTLAAQKERAPKMRPLEKMRPVKSKAKKPVKKGSSAIA